MCGIAGQLNWAAPTSIEVVRNMVSALRHRGPDANGVSQSGAVTFGHTRLAIVDLTPAGAQPMFDGSRERVVTFNGEIYNHQDLRRELSALGSVFRSQSDTEVILEAYRQWGAACVTRFNGMFAFALWDEQTQTLFAARDRLGKKPFYYHTAEHSLSFASELPALLQDTTIPDDINPRAIVQYLSLGYLTSAECINPHVHRLPPGHTLLWQRGKPLVVQQYWNLAEKFVDKSSYTSISEAGEELDELLNDAVKIRLMSDVPLGAFLSGGVDSSSVVAHMRAFQTPEACHTFSVGFPEETFSELENAREVASQIGVTHHDGIIDASIAASLEAIGACSGEPFADTSIIPMYYLSEFTRKSVTVALSGDGADEIFGGYETYLADKLHSYMRLVPAPVVSLVEKVYSKATKRDFGKVSRDYKVRQFLRGCTFPFAKAHFSWRELFTVPELQSMLHPEFAELIESAHPLQEFEKFDRQVAGAHYLDRAMYVDIKTWLVDDILVKVDRSTMAHSLEARAPFLDYRLVEFAARLQPNLKVRGWSKKHILKVSQKNRLPHQTLHRPKKGFNSPISIWLFGFLSKVCEEILQDSPLLEYVSKDTIRAGLRQHLAKEQDNSFKLFAIIQLHYFLISRKKQVFGKAA
jgi:asparagine synthase (glutamine-hydrolysing)